MADITTAVEPVVRDIQTYVPGYRLTAPPLFDGNKVSVLIEVTGAGDHLPAYAGNLDIMTSAAVRVGKELAKMPIGAHWGGSVSAPVAVGRFPRRQCGRERARW